MRARTAEGTTAGTVAVLRCLVVAHVASLLATGLCLVAVRVAPEEAS